MRSRTTVRRCYLKILVEHARRACLKYLFVNKFHLMYKKVGCLVLSTFLSLKNNTLLVHLVKRKILDYKNTA